MSNPDQPFYLIVTDHDRVVFAFEGPMTYKRPWQGAANTPVNVSAGSSAARPAPTATRSRLSIVAHKFADAPPGSIVRPQPGVISSPSKSLRSMFPMLTATEFHRLADVPPEVNQSQQRRHRRITRTR